MDQHSTREILITEVATADVWGCTTRGWCEEGWPVDIEHIQHMVDMRRYDTLMESRFPSQATNAFKGIENQWKRFDQLNEAEPETVAVGCPFCMTMLEDALKSRSLEEKMRVRDPAELIADATGTNSK